MPVPWPALTTLAPRFGPCRASEEARGPDPTAVKPCTRGSPTPLTVDRLVVVARGRRAEVAAPAVGGHGRRLGDVGGEEGVQARGRGVGQRGEPEPAETAAAGLAAAGLDRAGDQGLAGGAPAALAGSRA